jgi:hypothetical protein
LLGEKNRYKICSFSGEEAFRDPSIWGYYANGFKGLAIEVESELFEDDEKLLKRIKPTSTIPAINDRKTHDKNTRNILLSKSRFWKKEDEYRFLINSEKNYHKIGKITAIYFGNPYGRAVNRDGIYKATETLAKFEVLRARLREQIRGIQCHLVKTGKSGIEHEEWG